MNQLQILNIYFQKKSIQNKLMFVFGLDLNDNKIINSCYIISSHFKQSMISPKKQTKEKKRVRKNIICYFLAMANGHHATQRVQQQMASHPFFNPMLLFKKVSKEQATIKQRDYIQQMLTKMGIRSVPGIETYMKKHDLGKIIECEQFIETLLPYTPDILRNLNSTVVLQVKSSPALHPQIQFLFQQILNTEIYHILNISSFRKLINLNWNSLKSLILDDLNQYYGKCVPSYFDIVAIRTWIELWVQIDERDMLNMMRWVRGGDQQHLYNHFVSLFVQDVQCTCTFNFHHQSLKFKLSPKREQSPVFRYSVRPLSRKQSQMYERKISYASSKKQIMSNSSRRSTIKIVSAQKSKSGRQSIAQSTKKPKHLKNVNSRRQRALALWCQYLYTILTGEKALSDERQKLKNQIEKVVQILRQIVMSKKNTITKITKIIKFVDKYTNLSQSSKNLMQQSLSNLSIQNNVIISIFSCARSGSKVNTETNSKIEAKNESCEINNKTLKKQIADTLKNYCLTKCKLIKISQEMMKSKLHEVLFKVLGSKQAESIGRQNLTQILREMQIQFNEQNVQTLMRHFGDGNVITRTSFIRVFQIQGS